MIKTSEQETENETKKNTGKSYEELTQKIYQFLNKQSDVKNIDVKRDIILLGKTAEHQIDILWEFELSGVSYTTIVQAKDWKKNVELSHLLTFKGVLDDLPGQPRGVFVTKTGYQRGALDYARKNGIILCVLREPQSDDFKDQISSLNISFHITKPEVKVIAINIDEVWMKNELSRCHNSHGNVQLDIKISNNEMLYNEDDSEIGTIYDIFKPADLNTIQNQTVTKKFGNAYIKTPNGVTTRIKILDITCQIFDYHLDDEFTINLDEMVKHVLKDVLKNELKFLPI